MKMGNMSTLNCEEEVKLVEKLIKATLGLKWEDWQELAERPMQ